MFVFGAKLANGSILTQPTTMVNIVNISNYPFTLSMLACQSYHLAPRTDVAQYSPTRVASHHISTAAELTNDSGDRVSLSLSH